MIQKQTDHSAVSALLRQYRVTALLGPRQSGKTTLARQFKAVDYFDLENPRDLARLSNPQFALEDLKGLVVIDEIQRKPELFPLLRYLVDTNTYQRYLILGSASIELLRHSSESLAGRIAFYQLSGLRKEDLPKSALKRLWLRGGLPLSYLAKNDAKSTQWRDFYIQTFIERDISSLGIRIPPASMRRFWEMLCHYHGNMINFSDIGRSFGISDTTVRHYIEILQGTFMIRILQPWSLNIGKRLVKRPKIYMRDSGLFHSLIHVESGDALYRHPKLGSSWEGFALETVCRNINKPDNTFYFWATHTGAEVDLFWQHDGKNWACEFKFSDAPELTRSMTSALNDLALEKLWVVYPGDKAYRLSKKVDVIPLERIAAAWDYSAAAITANRGR